MNAITNRSFEVGSILTTDIVQNSTGRLPVFIVTREGALIPVYLHQHQSIGLVEIENSNKVIYHGVPDQYSKGLLDLVSESFGVPIDEEGVRNHDVEDVINNIAFIEAKVTSKSVPANDKRKLRQRYLLVAMVCIKFCLLFSDITTNYFLLFTKISRWRWG